MSEDIPELSLTQVVLHMYPREAGDIVETDLEILLVPDVDRLTDVMDQVLNQNASGLLEQALISRINGVEDIEFIREAGERDITVFNLHNLRVVTAVHERRLANDIGARGAF